MSTARKARLYYCLQLAAHRMQKQADRALTSAAGITTAQAAALSVIAVTEAATQREVARQLALNESAVTTMISRLMRLGLLERRRNEEDPRAWSLQLNKNGQWALRAAEGAFKSINRAVESELSAAEIEQLGEYLARIGNAFSK